MTEMADQIVMAGLVLDESESQRFAELVDQHAQLVYAIALSILRHPADAEDAAQECFLRLIRYRVRLALALDKRAFIARVAQRCALDRIARWTMEREEPLEEERHAPAVTEKDLTGEQQAIAQLAAAIRTLPQDLRRVVDLQQSGELTSEQIGKVLRIPAATVRSRMARAKALLRQKLEGGGHGPTSKSRSR